MSSTPLQEKELKDKCAREVQNAKDPVEKLRLKLLSRGSNGIKGMGRVFRNMDDNGDKKLDFEEFKKGLHDVQAGLTADECKEVFKRFDKDGSGTLDFEEFLVPLRKLNESRKAIILKAFQKVDKTGDGVITVEDLRGVYNAKDHKKFREGKWTEDQVFEEWLKNFDSPNDPDGKVTQEEFINYYSGLSASVDSNAYFDLMIRQAWKL